VPRAKGDNKLVCSHTGSWTWVTFEICRMQGGYGLLAACSLGDHWICPDPAAAGRYRVGFEPHAFASAAEAVAVRDAWRVQQRKSDVRSSRGVAYIPLCERGWAGEGV
jgi:hypothetical protein